nr:MAG TPA: protein of unknown function (UPF0239) [Bacteriophage sp.]
MCVLMRKDDLTRYTIYSVYFCVVMVFQFICFRVIYVLPKGKQTMKEST